MNKMLSILMLTGAVYCQPPTAAAVIDSVQARFSVINDYSVRAKLSVDLPKIRMPRKTLDIYFKQPDKIKVETDGFAVVPRQGIDYVAMLDSLANINVAGSEKLEGHSCWILAGQRIEKEKTFNTTVYIDQNDWIVRQIISALDTVQVVQVDLEYDLVDGNYLLPVRTTVTIDMSPANDLRLERYDPDINTRPQTEVSMAEEINGQVILEFSRYKVNRGIKDQLFWK